MFFYNDKYFQNIAIPNSARMSEIRPEDISDRYESRRNVPDSPENRKIDYEIIKSKIEDERNALNREWEQRLKLKEDEHIRTMEALEKANEHYSQQLSERDRLRSELDQQKQFNEQIIEKYEKALQNSIDAIKKQKDLESKIEQEKLELAQQAPYSAIRRYAEENIQNPMDLSMSLVIKESSTTATPSNKIVINTDPLHKLESIFEKQKSIAKGDYSESDDEEAQTANTFKFQEFLIETDNAQDIAQSLILVYMKNRTSKDKNTMLQSMINALSNEDHVSQFKKLINHNIGWSFKFK